MDITLLIPIVSLVVGTAGWLFVSRRQFERRNFAGVEEFSGFISMVASRIFERVVRLASGIALFVGVVGLMMFPGHLIHATTPNAVTARPAAPAASATAHARHVMILSAKCYFFDGRNRLIAVQPAASAPAAHKSTGLSQRCTLPAATRT